MMRFFRPVRENRLGTQEDAPLAVARLMVTIVVRAICRTVLQSEHHRAIAACVLAVLVVTSFVNTARVGRS